MRVRRVIRTFSTLRDYQHECIQESLNHFESGLKRIAVSLPVGSGKTVIFSNLIPRIKNPAPNAHKTLILAHRQELLFQAYRTVKKYSPDIKIGIEQGSRKPDLDCKVLIASVATLGRNRSDRLERYNPSDFKCIIIDEAHHSTASTYQKILNYFRVYDKDSQIKLWGCSATLRRHDGRSLAPTFEKVVFQLPVFELIQNGYLCDLTIKTIKTNYSLGKIATQNGDFNLAQLATTCDTSIRNQIVVATYLDQLQSYNMKSTLVFAVNVQHIQHLVQGFINNGIEAVGVHGGTPQDQREQILQDFKDQKFPVLVNCGIITEGVDIPNIDCLLMARPTKSGVLLQQMLGRGMRLHEGKKTCLVLDFVDTIDQNVMRATIPTLLGLNPDYVLDDTLSAKMTELADKNQNETNEPVSDGYGLGEVTISLIPFENPFALESIYKETLFTKKYSKFAWIRTGAERWVIFLLVKNETVSLERGADGLFHGYSRTAHRNIKSKPKEIMSHDNFESATRALDQYIVDKIGYHSSKDLYWDAGWRSLDMTPAQAKLMSKYGIKGDLNRGIAADIITKYLHGAKGHIQRQQQQNKISEKQETERKKLMII
ncbi:hypothetical protein HDV01_001591 [Terramyces sp. JEL0728]|nr:hypothetical protein HDV01_001591 [Terramyces sp. JEL0728]